MKNYTQVLKITCILIISFALFSCEKESNNNDDLSSITLSIKIVSTTPETNENGILKVNYSARGSDTFEKVAYNEAIEITLQNAGEMYWFLMEDANHGLIHFPLTEEELGNYSVENPLILQFEHYRNEKIAEFSLNAIDHRSIDLIIHQKEGTLYHIDWGDGKSDYKESKLANRISSSDFIRHDYETPGEYTISLFTTNAIEVTALDLQVRGNGKSAKIQTLSLEDLPSLETLSLGDNTLLNIDETLARFPNLKDLSLRFGTMEKIDLSNNNQLERLNLRGKRFTEIKNLENLSNLTSLGLDATVDNLDPKQYPNLELLYLFLNDLETIDVSQNPKLKSLNLPYNKLTEINLENNKELTILSLGGNDISELDLSNQKELEHLAISMNALRNVIPPSTLEKLDYLDLENSRLLDEEDLLEAVFVGQATSQIKNGKIIFNAFANLSTGQETQLNMLVNDFDWKITFPE